MLIFTTVIGCCASIIDVIIIMRWNIAIGSKSFYVVSTVHIIIVIYKS